MVNICYRPSDRAVIKTAKVLEVSWTQGLVIIKDFNHPSISGDGSTAEGKQCTRYLVSLGIIFFNAGTGQANLV